MRGCRVRHEQPGLRSRVHCPRFPSLAGPIPSTIFNLAQLRRLSLDTNKLEGACSCRTRATQATKPHASHNTFLGASLCDREHPFGDRQSRLLGLAQSAHEFSDWYALIEPHHHTQKPTGAPLTLLCRNHPGADRQSHRSAGAQPRAQRSRRSVCAIRFLN